MMDIAIVGGTGAEGFGLALRLLRAGHHVTIGSRSKERADEAVERARQALGPQILVDGAENLTAVADVEAVVVTVPFVGMIRDLPLDRTIASGRADRARCDESLDDRRGRTRVGGDHSVGRVRRRGRSARGAGRGRDRRRSAHDLGARVADLDHEVESDVLLCSDDDEAKRGIGDLIETVEGMRWVDAGPLANARIAEALTPLVISINRSYKVRRAGFRISGRDGWGTPP